MKKLLLTLVLGAAFGLNSQICTIDYSQTAAGIYPDTLPVATVGDFYDTDISFLFPTDTMGYNFTNFQIVSVVPPLGLSWQCSNDANGCNYDPQADPYGCARVWGTPLIPGQYNVTINVIADLSIQSGNATSFQVYLEVLPSIQSNAGFSMNPGFGCEDVTVDFINNIPSGSYSPVPNQTQGFLYHWDFGNGLQSTAENPASQTYSGAGDYYIDYTCTIDTFGFFLNQINLNNVNCTDAVGYGNPDVYVEIYDGSNALVHSSVSSPNDANMPQVVSLNLHLTNPPYRVMVWDDDNDNLWGTAPENCVDNSEGSPASVTLALPAIDSYGNTTQIGSNGGLNFTYTINKPVVQVNLTDTLTIYSNPPVPVINYTSAGSLLSTTDLGYSYQWYLNGNPISGASSAQLNPTAEGSYTVTAFDTTGCFSTSTIYELDFASLSSESLKGFKLFPNPTKDYVTISFDSSVNIKQIRLMDLTGRTLISQENSVSNNEFALDLSSQSKGIYVVALEDINGAVYTSKLIKE